MRRICLVGMLGAMLLASAGEVFGWSLLDEMTVIDPNLSAEVVWEIPDSKTYCQSAPQNLDRLACQVHQIDEFWIGSRSSPRAIHFAGSARPHFGTVHGSKVSHHPGRQNDEAQH